MNSDIRIAVSFKGHRKRKRLRMLLGPGSTDYLLDLWISTAMNHPTGVLTGMDETDIALEAGWEEDSHKFVSALVECGFLEAVDGVYQLHDWEEHQSYVVKAPERKASAQHAAGKRWAEKRNADSCGGHAEGMPGAMRNDEKGNAPLPSPLPLPLPSPVPEKEYSLRSYSSCSEQSAIAAEPPTPPLDPVITLPLNTGEEHAVTQGEVEIWADLYPAVDVLQALKTMKGWLIANERKRKTKNGVKRFINAWLAKEQDRGGNTAVVIRDGPPGHMPPQPAARTQYQKGRQDMEGMAKFVLAADKELANHGNDTAHHDGIGPHVHALPAANEPRRASGHSPGMGRTLS